jgi:hypothetical protein
MKVIDNIGNCTSEIKIIINGKKNIITAPPVSTDRKWILPPTVKTARPAEQRMTLILRIGLKERSRYAKRTLKGKNVEE